MRRLLVMFLVSVSFTSVLAQTTLDKKTVRKFQASDNPHISKHAYVLAGSIWRDSPILYVCWENPSAEFSGDMQLVQKAVSDTWQSHSQLQFVGWQPCAARSAGIRIRIDDSGPHTKGLGRQLNGMPAGMVLNFSFQNWSPACQSQHAFCVYSIAVHEFGHAIGFAHEQNRFDAPGECARLRQGGNGDLLLTPYDPHSVMNYCNAQYNNNGALSPLDITAVQELYGAR